MSTMCISPASASDHPIFVLLAESPTSRESLARARAMLANGLDPYLMASNGDGIGARIRESMYSSPGWEQKSKDVEVFNAFADLLALLGRRRSGRV